MLDLETLGISESAVVVQIGVVKFTRGSNKVEDTEKVLINIELADYQNYPEFKMDITTVQFWLSQNKKAQDKVFKTNPGTQLDVKSAFSYMRDFIGGAQHIWCHPSFDGKIVDFYLRALKLIKIDYWKYRDLRTLVDVTQYDYKNHPYEGVKHSALDDCMHQISYANECFKQLKDVGPNGTKRKK